MIAKILNTKASIDGAVGYNDKKVKKEMADIIYSQGFISDSMNGVIDRLKQISAQSSRIKYPTFHAALSFPKGEMLPDQIIDIAREYMDEMGYGNQPFVVYKHFDAKHPHVHILTTRIGEHTGIKIESDNERYHSMQISERLEEKYGLTKVERRSRKDKTLQEGVVKSLDEIIQDKLSKYKPKDVKELSAVLAPEIETIIVAGNKGIVFRKAEQADKVVSVPSSELPCFKKMSLKKQLYNNKQEAYGYRNMMKTEIENALKSCGKNIANFKEILAVNKITPIFATNSGGVYGISFNYQTEDNFSIKFKATDIDRTLSWNNIKKNLGYEDSKTIPQSSKNQELNNAKKEGLEEVEDFQLMQGFYGQHIDVSDDEWKKRRRKKPRL